MKFKVYIVLILMAVLLTPAANLSAFELPVPSAILIEAETGQVLYEKNADERMPPASITKAMAMLLAMEAVENGEIALDDTVTVSNYAQSMGGSQIFLNSGQTLTIEELLKAVTIASANDASVALAEGISGSYYAFVEEMNEKAQELGMNNTNFRNSTGLPEPDHYSTARDIAIMSREVVKYPQIREWGQIWVDYIDLPNRQAMLTNTNRLILSYPGLDGIKTGHTNEAGYCLAASAARQDFRLISVVLKTDSETERQEMTTRLLDYGFNNFKQETLLSADEIVQNVEFPGSKQGQASVRAAKNVNVILPRGNTEEPELEYMIKDEFDFPINSEDVVGEVAVVLEGEEVSRTDILAAENIERANIFTRLFRNAADVIRNFISRD
ncbi:MAG: D-alanyl-D-alanine carboxypeptidase family protein [Bacillota bacterium]